MKIKSPYCELFDLNFLYTFALFLYFFFAYVIYKRSLVLPNFYGDKVRSKFSAAEFLIALKS